MTAARRRPSSVDALRRGVGAVDRGKASIDTLPPVSADVPSRRPRREKPKPVRFTLDLAPDQHQVLKTYAQGIEAGASEVMRALLLELAADPALAGRVRDRVWQGS